MFWAENQNIIATTSKYSGSKGLNYTNKFSFKTLEALEA